jgi:hypothetical protein
MWHEASASSWSPAPLRTPYELQFLLHGADAGERNLYIPDRLSAAAAIHRGEKVALFAFDEELGLLFRRTRRGTSLADTS